MAKNKVFKSMDGNEAAAYVSYAFTEVPPPLYKTADEAWKRRYGCVGQNS